MGGSFHALYLHLVWSTWNRLPLISPEIEGVVFPALLAEARRLGGEVVAIGGVEDHVHVLVRVRATVSVAGVVKQLKGVSSHLVNDSPDAPDFFKWQGGYGAFTVSRWDVQRIQRYVLRQREHHRTGQLSVTLERIEPE